MGAAVRWVRTPGPERKPRCHSILPSSRAAGSLSFTLSALSHSQPAQQLPTCLLPSKREGKSVNGLNMIKGRKQAAG